jgi:hypothetical protein
LIVLGKLSVARTIIILPITVREKPAILFTFRLEDLERMILINTPIIIIAIRNGSDKTNETTIFSTNPGV